MSRTIVLGVIVAGLGAGLYYYLTQPEPTPAEQIQSAAQDTGDAVGDAVDSVVEQASEASEQAGQAATELADQAADEVASLANQGQDLLNSWIEDGSLAVQNFDYETLMTSVQESELTESLKTQALAILEDIKTSPETISEKLLELRALLSQQ